MEVAYIDHMGSDLRIVQAAKVSIGKNRQVAWGESKHDGISINPYPARRLKPEDRGVVNYMLRERHGCYDLETEVLTNEGWKFWPSVTGEESFVTRSSEGEIQYQKASHLVVRPWKGDMIKLSMIGVDLLVTPDHKMLVEHRIRDKWSSPELLPATRFLSESLRMLMGGGVWNGIGGDVNRGALLGMIIGDGNFTGTSISFHLKRRRKIEYLQTLCEALGFKLSANSNDTYIVREVDEEFRRLAKKCYTEKGEKIIPEEVLAWSKESLAGVLEGLINSDGSISASGKVVYSTTSYQLGGQIQEVALKVGQAAVLRLHTFGDGHFGTKPMWNITICRERNIRPRVGWTLPDREKNVMIVPYEGNVYCVTVPNGTLYVRRNGIPAWCGNTPFEHVLFTFYIQTNIGVMREAQRHRFASWNELSTRYAMMQRKFDFPALEDMRTQVGKPGHYRYEQLATNISKNMLAHMEEQCDQAFNLYENLVNAGLAKEVARGVLPLFLSTESYLTINLRSLFNFLGLRLHLTALKEIQLMSSQMLSISRAIVPETLELWEEIGRPIGDEYHDCGANNCDYHIEYDNATS